MDSPTYKDWEYVDGLSPPEIEALRQDPRICDPVDRGTPRGAFVDAIWAEDLTTCGELLDAHPELLGSTLRQWAHLKSRGSKPFRLLGDPHSSIELTDSYLRDIPPLEFACLLPRWKEADGEARAMTDSNLALIRLLIQRGAVLLWKERILAEVCWVYDSPEVMEILVNMSAKTLYGGGIEPLGSDWTLLQLAALKGRVGAVEYLLDHGASLAPGVVIHDSPYNGPTIASDGTPLNLAAKAAKHLVVGLLLRRGGSEYLEVKDDRGQTPLQLAASPNPLIERGEPKDQDPQENRERIVRMLIEAGAQFKQNDSKPRSGLDDPSGQASILMQLVTWGSADIIRYAVQSGCDVREEMELFQWEVEPDFWDYPPTSRLVLATPLHVAAGSPNPVGVQALIDLGADVNALDDSQKTPLHWLATGLTGAHRKRMEIIAWNIRNSTIHNRIGPQYHHLLEPEQWVTRLDAVEFIVDRLLDNHARINHQDSTGRTPLHYVSDLSLIRVIVHLIDRGADLALVDVRGRSVLHELSTVSKFLDWEAGKKRHSEPDPDYEALHASLRKALLSQDTINRLSRAGETALHVACSRLFVPMVSILLRLGADPNILDSSGSTALHRASRPPIWISDHGFSAEAGELWIQRFARIKDLLLEAGADADLPNGKGESLPTDDAIREEVSVLKEAYLRDMEEARRLEALRWSQCSGTRGRGRGGGISRGGMSRGG